MKQYEVVESKELSKANDKRYIVIDKETGKILDNAQGFGYKTRQKAHAGYAYKTRDKSKDKEKELRRKEIKKWLINHKEIIEALDDLSFDILERSTNEKIDSKFIRKILKEYNLETDFKPQEIIKSWQNL